MTNVMLPNAAAERETARTKNIRMKENCTHIQSVNAPDMLMKESHTWANNNKAIIDCDSHS